MPEMNDRYSISLYPIYCLSQYARGSYPWKTTTVVTISHSIVGTVRKIDRFIFGMDIGVVDLGHARESCDHRDRGLATAGDHIHGWRVDMRSRSTNGTQYAPIAAGRRSVMRMPGLCSRNNASSLACTLAKVASITTSMFAKGGFTRAARLCERCHGEARLARKSIRGRVDLVHHAHFEILAVPHVLIIRSMPILPESMVAALSLANPCPILKISKARPVS